jgi:hypothetical protein
MLLPRVTTLALTADRPPPAQPVTASGEFGEYWLGHCNGFRVGSPEGEVGVVDSVVYAADAGGPCVPGGDGRAVAAAYAVMPCAKVVSIDVRQARLEVRARPARKSFRSVPADGTAGARPPGCRAAGRLWRLGGDS